MKQALQIIKNILNDHEGMMENFPPRVYLNEFNAESLNILDIYWYAPADYWAFTEFSENVNLEILEQFNKEGIEFAFPTTTTYLEQSEGKSIKIDLDKK